MTSFSINLQDLAFILRQIQVSEDTSLAYTAAPKTITQAIMDEFGVTAANAAQLPYGLRTVTGEFNNLIPGQEEFGAADTLFPRLLDPEFLNDTDGDSIDFDGPGPGPTLTGGNYGVLDDANPFVPGNQPGVGTVVDADPRIISNLIVDLSVDNPAAIAAFLDNPLAIAAFEEANGFTPTEAWLTNPANVVAANEALQTLPNQSPDVGLSPGFNSWMTFFGQFFDHGLDLVTKGGNGTVYIPLQPDDPLYVEGSSTNFMALTRATVTLDENGVPQHENTTSPFVDQNQTYTSHPSHQVFLREYEMTANGAVATGKLLDGSSKGLLSNWAEIKAQAAEMLGILLDDFDVHNVPLLLTDEYGKFIPGANGYAQIATETGFVEGIAGGLALPENTVRTGHQFLIDIAHHATPSIVDIDENGVRDGIVDTVQTADVDFDGLDVLNLTDHDFNGDGVLTFADIDFNGNNDGVATADEFDAIVSGSGSTFIEAFDFNGDGVIDAADLVADDGNPLTYDDEMLDSHFVTGDGRGNENSALTVVHSIFHSEHNRMVDANKETILAGATTPEGIAFLNEWLLEDVTEVPADPSTLVWDGDRLFQAAKFTTEMQYQHLVFEEFSRRIQPAIDPFVFNNSPDVDPAIVAEFAHTVYRFGHSMLTGTVDRLDNNLDLLNGEPDQQTLIAMFLNPQSYLASGETAAEIDANFIRGLSRDVGSAIDEFIVDDVRDNLLGLPLDLGAINIARGRDTGIPSLNNARAQLYDGTGLASLTPYTSWVNFSENIKNQVSIINFIAAYGTHATIEAATTVADKRAAATAIVFGGGGAPADRLDFLYATGAYAGGDLGGLNNVDLWIGGLAEANPEFGGMLGTTFNYVFEYQLEALQNGDRFYYLTRTQGTNILNQLEPSSFADLVIRNSELGGPYSTHLSGQLFITPDYILELDRGIAQEDYSPNGGFGNDPDDLAGLDPLGGSLFSAKVERDYTGATQIVDPETGITHDVGGTLQFFGGEHVVLGGTEGNDRLIGDIGDDTLWGDGGDDYLNGRDGADNVFGGDGDDIIEDRFGDDVLRGERGNDVISTSGGVDLVFGGAGIDYLLLGQDASEIFGGEGDDFILGSAGGDFLLGNEGSDWIEGGAGFDTLAGDNSDLFFNSPIIGHDVLFGHGDETDYDAESGDDIMGSGASVYRYEGMFGFDWGIAKNDNSAIDFDLTRTIFTTDFNDILRDRFDNVEALSGWDGDDVLKGDNKGHIFGVAGATAFDPLTADTLFFDIGANGDVVVDNVLNNAGVDRIDGFREWFDGAAVTLNTVAGTAEGDTFFRDGNVLMGGDGSDFILGRGGFDVIDGDAWLNVRIKIVIPDGPNAGTYSAESMSTDTAVAGPYAGKVFNTDVNGDPDFSSPAFGGRTLTSLMLDRTINPGAMSIVREIKYDNTNLTGPDKDIDTAAYQGVRTDYAIEGLDGPDAIGRAFDLNGDGFISITDLDNGTIRDVDPVTDLRRFDDTDLLKNIEQLQFAGLDGTLNTADDEFLRIDLTAPTDIRWNGVSTTNNLSPISGEIIADLTTTDDDTTTGFVYSMEAGSSPFFSVSPEGVVTSTSNIGNNQNHVLSITTTDTTGAVYTEAFILSTLNNAANTMSFDEFDNIVYGRGGNDNLSGLGGDDNLFGQGGADTLNGGAGDDMLDGGAAADTLNGDDGNDTLLGGAGNDTLNGGDGLDTLLGGAGNDTLNGGAGDDMLTGGNGVDTFVFGIGFGNDTITDFDDVGGGQDRIDLTAFSGMTGFGIMSVVNGSDTLITVSTAAGIAGTINIQGISGLAGTNNTIDSGDYIL